MSLETAERKKQIRLLLQDRKTAYLNVLGIEDDVAQKLVREDLERFCRAKQSCFHADPRIHAALEGRREVFLRIQDFLSLSVEELSRKYAGSDGGDNQ